MSRTKATKLIHGKRYILYNTYNSEGAANGDKNELQIDGYLTEVTKSKNQFGYPIFKLWVYSSKLWQYGNPTSAGYRIADRKGKIIGEVDHFSTSGKTATVFLVDRKYEKAVRKLLARVFPSVRLTFVY